MPHSMKKQRIEGNLTIVEAAGSDFLTSFDDLSVDVLAKILGFLHLKEIMRKRRINKKLMEVVKKTIAPLSDFRVDSIENYSAINVMTEALPNLQQITIGYPGERHKYNDGEDPDEFVAASTADRTSLDITIMSNLSKLRVLEIECIPLNGRYPFLFNSFPLLEKLSIQHCNCLKWDLEMLAGFPLLKELDCIGKFMTGNINSLRVLKDTLERVRIGRAVEGNFMDLADFPHLKELDLEGTAVTGDIRDIGENDFSALEQLILPKGVYGGVAYELQRISDAPDLVRAVYQLKKQRPGLKMWHWHGNLSEDSPDWYASLDEDDNILNPMKPSPPFRVVYAQAGSRVGYRWEDKYGNESCEVNWLDPEPDRGSGDYKKYLRELQVINCRVTLYSGFHQPPSEEEFNRLVDEYYGFQG